MCLRQCLRQTRVAWGVAILAVAAVILGAVAVTQVEVVAIPVVAVRHGFDAGTGNRYIHLIVDREVNGG